MKLRMPKEEASKECGFDDVSCFENWLSRSDRERKQLLFQIFISDQKYTLFSRVCLNIKPTWFPGRFPVLCKTPSLKPGGKK